ncbi:FtsW/RodA/SpoVE family cell cycle protein [Peribacillus sp. FSL H8-0477]|uniref:FtsW/RodA/SpoVE family cell cycle protein n=1 Tax=Peribacillus sp. FSL H8-0477 TaxID=2921388 RepID=UPI0030F76E8C
MNGLMFSNPDFVFVGLTHTLGWLFGCILASVLLLVIYRMSWILLKVDDHFGKLLIVGGLTVFAVQVIANLGMSLGILPIISISLPFISYGAVPVLINSVIFGTILSVYRRKDLLLASEK